MEWFKKCRKATSESEAVETEKVNSPADEWVWIEGYKGTEKDMKCRDFQFEFGATYSMSKDEVSLCSSGFHLCRDLKDVYEYYSIGNGHRYFKVQALVRRSDLDKYGTYVDMDSYFFSRTERIDKLVAAEIRFLEELTVDEILKHTFANKWPDKYKTLAIEIGLKDADLQRKNEILTELGYNETLAKVIVNANRFAIAEAVGCQKDLSMDMKVWTIFTAAQ